MPHSITINIREKGQNDAAHQAIISDSDWTILLAFGKYADQLLEAMPPNLHANIEFNWNSKDGLTYSGQLPSKESISAVLHWMRPFVLQKKEPTNFYKVANILSQHFAHPALLRLIQKQRDLFSSKDFQSQLTITTSTPALKEVLNSEASFQLWLNAFEYHRDAEKQMRLEELCGPLPFDGVRALFISML